MGKSSLLNALAGRRIARVSTTPGKTRAFNAYDMGGTYYFLDLPGYGYARAGKADRTAFRHIIRHTLERERLAGTIWLLDIRRDPSEDDRTIKELFAAAGTRVLAAITKSDKLPRAQRLRRQQALQTALALEANQVIVTSTRTLEGIADLKETIAAFLWRAA